MRFVLSCFGGLLSCLAGCASLNPYPDFLNDPAVKEAIVDAFAAGHKQLAAQGTIANPELSFYYKVEVGSQLNGVVGAVTGQVQSAPR